VTASGLPTPFAEEVLDVVSAVPPGRAASYGDVARMVGRGGPRQVGTVLGRFGSGVPWWRVVRADGTPAPALAREALRRLRGEGVPLTPDGTRVDLDRARWQPDTGPPRVSDPGAGMTP
jgi:alkylated DNA nucleotide flippase Atl1